MMSIVEAFNKHELEKKCKNRLKESVIIDDAVVDVREKPTSSPEETTTGVEQAYDS